MMIFGKHLTMLMDSKSEISSHHCHVSGPLYCGLKKNLDHLDFSQGNQYFLSVAGRGPSTNSRPPPPPLPPHCFTQSSKEQDFPASVYVGS